MLKLTLYLMCASYQHCCHTALGYLASCLHDAYQQGDDMATTHNVIRRKWLGR